MELPAGAVDVGALTSPDDPRLADEARQRLSAYIHVPFCARVCPYCDFAVVAGQDEQADRYLSAVAAEIAMEPEAGPLNSVFIGGGTPSRLTAAQVQQLLHSLSERFGLSPTAEITMEANPEDWTQEKSDGMRSAGVNRVSFGAQSFDDEVLTKLGRMHRADDISAALDRARRTGFLSVSLDLIFGEPTETGPSWARTVQEAISCAPDHVSIYALTVERGTVLSRSIAGGAPAPDEDDQADKYLKAVETLQAGGYVRYEVSNLARAGHGCQYNLTTWAQGDYLAFGLGAHGHRQGVRRRNIRRLEAYLNAVESGKRPEAGREAISGWEAEQERLMLGLRRTSGVEAGQGGLALMASEIGRQLERAGVMSITAGRLRVLRPLLTDTVIREVLGMAEPKRFGGADT